MLAVVGTRGERPQPRRSFTFALSVGENRDSHPSRIGRSRPVNQTVFGSAERRWLQDECCIQAAKIG